MSAIVRHFLNLLLWLFGFPSTEEFDYFPENSDGRAVASAARPDHKEHPYGRHSA